MVERGSGSHVVCVSVTLPWVVGVVRAVRSLPDPPTACHSSSPFKEDPVTVTCDQTSLLGASPYIPICTNPVAFEFLHTECICLVNEYRLSYLCETLKSFYSMKFKVLFLDLWGISDMLQLLSGYLCVWIMFSRTKNGIELGRFNRRIHTT